MKRSGAILAGQVIYQSNWTAFYETQRIGVTPDVTLSDFGIYGWQLTQLAQFGVSFCNFTRSGRVGSRVYVARMADLGM